MHINNSTARFPTKKSVKSASFSYLDFIYTEIDLGKYVICLLFDLSEAFDMIDKKYLMVKLDSIRIRGGVLTYIQCYMENTKLHVKLGESMSSTQNIKIGVPQGSVFGSTIFLLYVNDKTNYITYGQVTIFSDDITISESSEDLYDLELKANCVIHEKTVFINHTARR
nr:unnamed protein product [Callosobruchus analis]